MEAVKPGQVIGIDVAPDVLDAARAAAAGQNVTSVFFEQASVYALPYADGSFDAAYGHQVLQHPSDPGGALAELRRVLKTGGLLGVRDVDYASMIAAPDDPLLQRFFSVYDAVARRNGGEPNAGRYLRGWLQGAGFQDIAISADTWTYTDKRDTVNWGDSWAERVTRSAMAEQAVTYGIADQDQLEAIGEAWRRWARSPDAFLSMIHVAALGLNPA